MSKKKVIKKNYFLNYDEIYIECNSIRDIKKQCLFLENEYSKIKKFQVEYLVAKFKELDYELQNEIQNYISTDSNFEENSSFNDKFIEFLYAIEKIKLNNPLLSYIDEENYKTHISMKDFNKENIFMEIDYDNYINLLNIFDMYQYLSSTETKIFDLILIKRKFIEYKEKYVKYNFNHCNFDYNLKHIIEFSLNFESLNEKLIYLKYMYDNIKNKSVDSLPNTDFSLSNEIKKIENIININPNINSTIIKTNKQEKSEISNSELNKPEKNQKEKIKIIQSKKITWLKDFQDLIFLFERLEQLGFIEYNKEKNKLLDLHFNWLKDDRIINDNKDRIRDFRSKINSSNSLINNSDSIKDLINEFENKIKKPK